MTSSRAGRGASSAHTSSAGSNKPKNKKTVHAYDVNGDTIHASSPWHAAIAHAAKNKKVNKFVVRHGGQLYGTFGRKEKKNYEGRGRKYELFAIGDVLPHHTKSKSKGSSKAHKGGKKAASAQKVDIEVHVIDETKKLPAKKTAARKSSAKSSAKSAQSSEGRRIKVKRGPYKQYDFVVNGNRRYRAASHHQAALKAVYDKGFRILKHYEVTDSKLNVQKFHRVDNPAGSRLPFSVAKAD